MARTGTGDSVFRVLSGGGVVMLRARGDDMAVPKSEKASGVRGAGVRLRRGVVVRVGGGIVVCWRYVLIRVICKKK